MYVCVCIYIYLRQPEALHPAVLSSLAHHGHMQPMSTKRPAPSKPCHPATRRPVKRKPPHDDKPRQPEALHPAVLASFAHHGHMQPSL